ncbi:VWA domain-containing protein [Rossellomorea aquimaris]|uniref:VWA domain-containing protein n=1 Tax=Rossellomorea aquimaris TaxID=189382 RepID=UPI001CD7DE18|nr:VWA domain-containing protein [Rossellomorea aquimaris]MCA1056994.1 VWA domain-containing protein [Rossellomorea aquimaris]
MRKLAALLISCSLIGLAGCSGEETANKDKKEPAPNETKKTEEKAAANFPEAPAEAEEIVEQPYGGKMQEVVKKVENGTETDIDKMEDIMKDFPVEGLSEEEIFNGIVSWFALDYTEPYDALKNYDPDFGEYEIAAKEEKKKNVVILIDSSGSMAAEVSGGQKMELAKEAVGKFAAGFPDDATISLRVYGHKGTGSDEDKNLSCSSDELIYEPDTYDQSSFDKALTQFKPSGWTPLGSSLKSAYEDLKQKAGDDTENIVYVVSDGVETCDGNPVEEAGKLADSDLKATVNIIGFDVYDEGQQQLKSAAEAGNGKYATVNSKDELENSLQELLDNAVEKIERNFDKASSGIEINNRSVALQQQVDDLGRTFDELSLAERGIFEEAISYLQDKEKIDRDTSMAVDDLANERLETLEDFSEDLVIEAREKVKSERESLFEAME